jgi:DNA polymerase-3 subunit gamma/tau
VVIIENADRLQESVRNALLKILEEPPEQALFVLTTTRRQAIMPTILSRCRTYTFDTRTPEQNRDILKRIFHLDTNTGNGSCLEFATANIDSIDAYFRTFLPSPPEETRRAGQDFLASCLEYQGGLIPVPKQTKFEPKLLLQVFFEGMHDALKPYLAEKVTTGRAAFAAAVEKEARVLTHIRECYTRIRIYNQSTGAALENLAWELCCGLK